MTYTIKIKDKKLMQHGLKIFDREYYGLFFKKYTFEEMLPYYRFFQGWIRFLDRFLPVKKGNGRKVLEIGCGIGAFAKILDERGFKVKAIDISPYIIEKAKKILPQIDFQVLDIEKNTIKNEKFDYIFALEVLEHLRNPTKVLKKINGMLKDGGILVFSTPYPTKEMLADPMHISINLPKVWISEGKKTGFKIIEFKHVSFIPFLYRFHSFFSRALPFKTDSNFINSTCIYIFRK